MGNYGTLWALTPQSPQGPLEKPSTWWLFRGDWRISSSIPRGPLGSFACDV